MPGRAGKSWRSAPSHIAGGAGCLLEHASTSTGQVNGSGSCGEASEVFLVLEAVKVGGHTPDRPLTDFGPLWTDRRRLCLVVLALWRVMAGLPVWWRAAPAVSSSRIAGGN